MRLFILCSGILACAAGHALVIDGFTDGFATATTKVDANYQANATVPGGIRSIDHDFIANPNNRNILTELDANDPGNFYIEAGSNVTGAVDLYYAGGALPGTPTDRPFDYPDFNGLGILDLSAFNAFKVSYVGNDQNSTALVMRLFDATNTAVFSGTTIAAGDGFALIPFASFTGNVDFSIIDKVHLRVELPTGNDITLTNFEAVPEPATLALAALGLAAIARRRKSN